MSRAPLCLPYDPRSMLNSQPTVITVIDPGSHTVQFQNDFSLRKFGDIVGQRCYERIAGGQAPCTFCRMQEALNAGEILSNAVAFSNGQHLLVHWAKTATATGEVHVIETITDATEHKRLETALQEAQKMEVVWRIAGGLAHDFNNLLMVINGYSDQVLRECRDPKAGRNLELIKQAGLRAATLTQKLLAFTRQQPFQQSVVSINEVLEGMHEFLQRLLGEPIRLSLVLEARPSQIKIDPVQLEQVILNLAMNARDAMPHGGQVMMRTHDVELKEDYVARHPGARHGRYVALSVIDTGIGMAPETQAHLFEPFFTTKPTGKGTGLGLTTVYGIVKQYHGYIEVESQQGVGSIFTVYFPRLLEISEASCSMPRSTSSDACLLVVEDETPVRELIVNILRNEGHTVLEARNGAEGLELIQGRRLPCRLVVTDVVMPEMTGPAMITQLRPFLPNLKVLFISGYTEEVLTTTNGLDHPVFFLQKPIMPDLLLQTVQAILKS